MYKGFYGFQNTPFKRGIPSDCLFLPPELSEVTERLQYVAKNQLFAVLTGDCGTGKTTILRWLDEHLDSHRYKMLYISDSKLTPSCFYRLLLEQLGIVGSRNRSIAKRQLHERVAAMKAIDNISTVCVVDESHLLNFEMLEEIRFLLNMKFDSVSPIALILAGQPELWERRLVLQKCNAIRQRIDVQSILNHYDRSRAGEYISHQLSYAGAQSDIFTDKAVDQIYEYSKGIARTIDKVCTSVLIYGSQNRLRLIDDHAVDIVLKGEFM